MKKSSTAKAELNSNEKPAFKQTWTASTSEIIITKRESRSSKPEVVYRSPHTSREPISVQPKPSPQPPILQPEREQNIQIDLEEDQEVVIPHLNLESVGDDQVEVEEVEQVNDEDVINDDDVFLSDVDEMAEDRSIVPSQFSGKVGEDGEEWIRHFVNCCNFKGYDDAKRLALMKVLLVSNAAVWLESQEALRNADGAPVITTFNELKTAFENRYKTPDILKYKSAKEIFTRRQEEGESCDNYIEAMRKLGRQIGAEDRIVIYAVLSGLRPNFASYVTRQRPQTLEQLTEAARLAELTTTENDQFAEVKTEIRKLAARWDQMTAAPIVERRENVERRTPSPKRVTFSQPPVQSEPSSQNRNTRGGYRGAFRGSFRGGFNARNTNNFPQRGQELCSKCGRSAHTNFLFCPARNRTCNSCHKTGHFAVVCRAARRGRE